MMTSIPKGTIHAAVEPRPVRCNTWEQPHLEIPGPVDELTLHPAPTVRTGAAQPQRTGLAWLPPARRTPLQMIPAPQLRLDTALAAAARVVLYPTDFSEHSRVAFDLACTLANAEGHSLTVLHVVAKRRDSTIGAAPVPPLPAGYLGGWESRLRLLRTPFADLHVDYRVAEGDSVAGILNAARESGCDLLVMGTKATKGLVVPWRRSVSEALARQAHCPVLKLSPPRSRLGSAVGMPAATRAIIAGTPEHPGMPGPATILCPVDLSAPVNLAFETACLLARQSGSKLIVLHVAPIPKLYVKRGYRWEMEDALQRLTQSVPSLSITGVFRTGPAAPAITEVASERRCDLIVMGARSHGWLNKLFLGSVAREVRRDAPCPVLTVTIPHAPSASESRT